MTRSVTRRLGNTAVITGAAGLSLLGTVQTFRDTDVWWHLELGRYISTHGIPMQEPFAYTPPAQPWVGQQWLYEVLLAKLVGITPVLASITMGLAATTAFIIAARTLPRDVRIPVNWLAFSLLVNVFVAAQLLGVRGQVITVLGVAMVMWVIGRWRQGQNRVLWLLPPILAIWCNLHAGFFLGLVLLVVAIVLPQSPQWGGRGNRRLLLLATVATAASTVLNPAGIHLYQYVASTFSNSSITTLVTEWLSPDFHNPWLRFFELDVLALVAAWALSPGGPKLGDVVFAGGAFVASLTAQRNVSIFAVIATPQLARYGFAAWEAHRHRIIGAKRLKPPPLGAAIIGGIALFAAIGTGVAVSLTPGLSDLASGRFEAQRYPKAAVDYVLNHYPNQRLYAKLETGGYLVYRIPENRVVLIYGETAIFGTAGIQRYLDIHLLRPNWTSQLAATHAHHAILPSTTQEVAAFHEVGWRINCYDAASDYVVMSEDDLSSITARAIPSDPRLAPACLGNP